MIWAISVIWSMVSSTHKKFERKWTLRKVTCMKREETVIFILQRMYMISAVSQFSLILPLYCIVK